MADITLDTLRLFVNERLTAVAEDILSVFVRTIFQYQQEIDIQRRQLDSLSLNPDIKSHVSDFFPVCKTEASPEQHDRRPSLAQKDQKITEELEELLQWPEQADRLTMTVPAVKTDDDHNGDTEHTKPQADVEDCRASQPSSHVQPLSSHCSDSDTEDSDEWEETRESLNTQNVETLPLSNLSQDLKSSKRTPSSRSYRGKRRYGCTHCGKRFLRSANLRVHMVIHTEEKPLSCKVCGKKYALNVHLARHMRAHTAEKAFSCPVCGKEFTRSGHLKVHMITHTGEKPFKCTICGRGFNINKNLTRHTWTHTGEKPFHCTGCGKGYIEMCDLRKHLRKTICGNSYGVHVYSTNT